MSSSSDRFGLTQALRDPNVKRLLLSTGSSNLAIGVFLGSLPLVVATAGHGPLGMGVVSASLTIWWVLAFPMAAFVDRHGPGPVLKVAAPLRMAALLAIAAHVMFDGSASFAVLVAGAAFYGFVDVIASNASSAIPALVIEQSKYDDVYSLLHTVNRVASLVLGPSVGAVLLMAHPFLPFALAGVCLLVAYFSQLPLLADPRAKQPDPVGDSVGWHSRIFAGVPHIWSDRFLRLTVITLIGVVIAEELVLIVVTPYFRDGAGLVNWQEMLGFIRSGAGVLGILAASAAGMLARRFQRIRVLCVVAAGAALCPAILAIAPHAAPVFIALAVATVAESIWVPLVQSEMARRTPGHLMARTRATVLMITWGTLPLTSVAGGALSEQFGIRPILLVASVAALVSCLLGVWRLPRDMGIQAEAGQGSHAGHRAQAGSIGAER